MLRTRLQELATAFRTAATNTESSRAYNYKRLLERAKAREVNVGDAVNVLANGASPLDPKWDHGYVAVTIRGPVVTVKGPGNCRRVVNRDKIRLVNPQVEWDTLS